MPFVFQKIFWDTLYRMNDCFDRLTQWYYSHTGIFQMDYSVTYKFAFSPDWSCLLFNFYVKRTVHRQDFGAKFNLTYHNGTPVADILNFDLQKGMFCLGKKILYFPIIFLFMKSKGANFAWVCIIILGNWWNKNFFQKSQIFMENDKNWISFVFTVLPIHIKIKSLLNYKSVCYRVIKPSGFCHALTWYNRPIRGSSPDSVPLT